MEPKRKKQNYFLTAGSYIALSICRLVALLPIRFLYAISDCISFFLHYIIGYRKKVVRKNLQDSFPDKSPEELKQIEKKFYRHLADFFMEYLFLLKLNSKELDKRLEYKNCELMEELYNKEKDVILIMGHYGNWELFSHYATRTKYAFCPVYKEQSNSCFDTFLTELRSKNKAVPVEMKNAFKYTYANKRKDIRTILVLIADQSPVETKFFTDFLSHPGTPVFEGPERIGKALDMAIVFGDVKKEARGHYSMEFVLLHENPKETAHGEITGSHVHYLENMIKEKPEYWLWSHRRWKRMEEDFIRKTAPSTEHLPLSINMNICSQAKR